MNVAMNEQWIPVCSETDLLDNLGSCALVNGEQVAIFKLASGALYAVGNHDPFSGSNVLSRGIAGDLKGKHVIASPIYKQHFDLETGVCLEDESVSIPSYSIRVRDGQVEIASASL